MTITVILAVRLIVLLVIADEIGESEPIVGSDKIDTGMWSAAFPFVQVTASGQPVGEAAYLSTIAFPEATYGIPILGIPFRPEDRKVADLISAFTQVPRLRN